MPKLDLITEFDPVTHIGKANGEVWPSVTQMLQEHKLIDYSGVPFLILERKRILGTRVGKATVLIDECRLDEEHFNTQFPECVPYLEGYRKFRVMENFEATHKEVRLWSPKWKFHGAPDESGVSYGNMGGRLAIVDYKCTWKMYASTGAQLSGYEILIRENASILGIDRALLRKGFLRFGLLLKPTGSYDLVPFTDKTDLTDFQACIHLHWAKRNKYKTTKGVFYDDIAAA